MMVAGLGSRSGVSVGEVRAAIDAACAAYGIEAIDLLATGETKASERAFAECALAMGKALEIVAQAALTRVADATLTRSELSQKASGVPSLSEAAALAAAGSGARLLGPRITTGPVTCALAEGSGR